MVRVTSLPSTAGTRAPGRRDDRAVAALLEGLPARRAHEVLLHHQLDSAAGLAGTGHVADEGGRRAALRVGALGPGLATVAVDARDPLAEMVFQVSGVTSG